MITKLKRALDYVPKIALNFKLGDAKKIALGEVSFDADQGEDSLDLHQFTAIKEWPLKKAILWVVENISTFEPDVCFCLGDDKDNDTECCLESLWILPPNNIKNLIRLLRKNVECLRGIDPHSIIICGDANQFIAPTSFAGYIPSAPTLDIEYRGRTYVDDDYGQTVAYEGEPVYIHGQTGSQDAFPTDFKLKNLIAAKDRLWFAVEYKTKMIHRDREKSEDYSIFP